MKRLPLAAALLVLFLGCTANPPPAPPPPAKKSVEVHAPGVDVNVEKGNVDVKAPGADVQVDRKP